MIRAALIPGCLMAVAAVGLLHVPLLSEFDYEFNQLLSIIAVPLSAAVAIRELSTRIRTQPRRENSFEEGTGNFYIGRRLAGIYALMMMPAVAAVAAVWLLRCSCPALRGMVFFALLPMAGVLVGSGLGVCISALVEKRRFLCVLASLSAALVFHAAEVYVGPSIAVYSVLWGYYPGPIYDEWLPVTDTLLWHRALAAAVGLVLFALGTLGLRRRRRGLLGLAVVGLVGVVLALDSVVGARVSYERLDGVLSRRLQTGAVDVRWDPSLDSIRVRRIGWTADLFCAELRSELQLADSTPVRLYVYADEAQKKRWMGAGPTNFAAIWRNEIHLNSSDADRVLKHELTHVLASEFGVPVVGTTRLGLLEGLAVASDWNAVLMTPHQWAAAVYRQGSLPDVAAWMRGVRFFAAESQLGYTVSGSFVRYLLERFGPAPLKRVYAGESFRTAFGKELDSLTVEWRTSLERVPLTASDVRLASLLLRPGIFSRRCPHQVAEHLHDANEAYEQGRYLDADGWAAKALRIQPQNSSLMLFRAKCRWYAGRWDSALVLAESLLSSPNVPFTAEGAALLLKGDIHLVRGQPDTALRCYHETLDRFGSVPAFYLAAHKRLSFFGHLRQVHTLKALVATEDRKVHVETLRVLVEEDTILKVPRFWLGTAYREKGDNKKTVELLNSEALSFNDRTFEAERLKTLGDAFLDMMEYERAADTFEDMLLVADREAMKNEAGRRWRIARWMAVHPR